MLAPAISILCMAFGQAPAEERKRPIDGVSDNSFLIEEAYNQEPRVVQHVFTAQFGADHRGEAHSRSWDLSFTQEWPIFSQTHQFAYSVPYSFLDEDAEHDSDIGDASLAYRLQLLTESDDRPAIAPTLELILPTGDEDRGFGTGEVGYGFVIPVSKTLGERVAVHFNAAVTYTPNARMKFSDGTRSSELDLLEYSLGGSLVYAVTDTFHLLVEAVWNSSEGLEEKKTRGEHGRLYADRDRGEEVVISPGLRWAWNLPGDLQIVPGISFPIGLSEDATDYGVFFYFSVEHPF